jgi:hypothetical protein
VQRGRSHLSVKDDRDRRHSAKTIERILHLQKTFGSKQLMMLFGCNSADANCRNNKALCTAIRIIKALQVQIFRNAGNSCGLNFDRWVECPA